MRSGCWRRRRRGRTVVWPTQGYGPLPPVFLLLPDTRRATRAAYWRAAEQLLLPVTALDPAEPLAEAVAHFCRPASWSWPSRQRRALWAATHWAAARMGRRRGRRSFRNSLFGGGFDHAAAPGLRVLNAGDGVHADPLAALALARHPVRQARPDAAGRHAGGRRAPFGPGPLPDPRAHHIGRARAARGRAPPSLLPEGLPQLGVFRSARWTRGCARCRCHHPAAERRGRRRRATAVAARLRRRLSAQPPGAGPGAVRCVAAVRRRAAPASKPRWRSTPRWRAPATSGTRWSTRSGWRRCASCRTRWDARWPQGARMRLHITNGRLIDPAAGVDRRADRSYIADGHVAAVDVAPADSRRIGASRPTAWRCCRAWWIYARAWPVPMARHRPMRCAPR